MSGKPAARTQSKLSARPSGSKSSNKNNDWSSSLPKRCLTTKELHQQQLCCPCPGDTPYAPTCICIQQTPRIICRKNIIWVQKLKNEPAVINSTRIVMIPKVCKVSRPMRVPEVTWTEGFVRAPKIQYRKMNVTTYEIKHTSKSVNVPQEICTSFMCRPKPQWICIPPPTDYCCYSMDSLCNLPNQCPPTLPSHPQQSMLHNYPGSPGYPNPPVHPGGGLAPPGTDFSRGAGGVGMSADMAGQGMLGGFGGESGGREAGGGISRPIGAGLMSAGTMGVAPMNVAQMGATPMGVAPMGFAQMSVAPMGIASMRGGLMGGVPNLPIMSGYAI